MDLVTLLSTHLEVGTGRAKDLDKARDKLREKTEECHPLKSKAGNQRNELATLRGVQSLTARKIQNLKLLVALEAKTFVY